MRRRGFRGKARRKGPRYEVSQLSLLQSVSVTTDFTRDDPAVVSFPLLSQWGLITTADLTIGAGRVAVIDSSVRGVAIASVYYDFNVAFAPAIDASVAPARFFVEVADCLYVDDIAQSPTGSQETDFSPETTPNLFTNQIGSNVLGTADTTTAGGFSEVFQFPDRILYRRWGVLDGAQVDDTGNNVIDQNSLMSAPTSSLKMQSPVDYAAKRIKRKAFLKDNQGLFVSVNLVGHNPDPIDVVCFCNAVIVYRSVR